MKRNTYPKVRVTTPPPKFIKSYYTMEYQCSNCLKVSFLAWILKGTKRPKHPPCPRCGCKTTYRCSIQIEQVMP